MCHHINYFDHLIIVNYTVAHLCEIERETRSVLNIPKYLRVSILKTHNKTLKIDNVFITTVHY